MSKKHNDFQKLFNEPSRKLTRKQLIKVKLILKGIPQQRIADELEIDKAAVSAVINGRGKSSRVDKWIEKNLGIPANKHFFNY